MRRATWWAGPVLALLAAAACGGGDEGAGVRSAIETGALPIDAEVAECPPDADCGVGVVLAGDVYGLIGAAPDDVVRGVEISAGVPGMVDIATIDGVDPGWYLVTGPVDAPSVLLGPDVPTRPMSRAVALEAETALCGSGLEPVAGFVDCDDRLLVWDEEVDDPPTGRPEDIFELSGTTVTIREPVGELSADLSFVAAAPEELIAGLAAAPGDRAGFGLYRFGYRIDERADDVVRGVILVQSRAHGLLRYEEFVEPFEARRQGGTWWLARQGPIAASVLGDDRAGREAADERWAECCDVHVVG